MGGRWTFRMFGWVLAALFFVGGLTAPEIRIQMWVLAGLAAVVSAVLLYFRLRKSKKRG